MGIINSAMTTLSWLYEPTVCEEIDHQLDDKSKINIYCSIEDVDTYEIRINKYAFVKSLICNELPQRLCKNKVKVDFTQYHIEHNYKRLTLDDRLCCSNITNNAVLSFVPKPSLKKSAGMSNGEEDTKINHEITFTSNDDKKDKITIKSYHISCASHSLDFDNIDAKEEKEINYVGIVLYANKNEENEFDWRKNGYHCLPGYIILQKTDTFYKPNKGTHHQQLYNNVFGEFPNENVIGAGFAIRHGQPKFNSGTFNCNNSIKNNNNKICPFHDSFRECSELEERWIRAALQRWRNNERNTPIKQYQDICWSCILKINSIKEF